MEVTCPSDALESTYKFTCCRNSEDHYPNSHLKSSVGKFSAFCEAEEAPAGRGL
jgi:hypothetical protein